MDRRKNTISFVLNLLIAAVTVVGMFVMFVFPASGPLSVNGLANFKFYTVLSNVFCGAVAAVYLCFAGKRGKMPRGLVILKMMAASAVFLTFLMILLFFGPLYGHQHLYNGSNLEFHLIIPLLAVIDFIVLDMGGKIPFRNTLLSVLPTVAYGTCYALNLLINGIGEWPNSNDFYGLVNWGYPVGFGIFGIVVLMIFLLSCLLRVLNHKAHANYK